MFLIERIWGAKMSLMFFWGAVGDQINFFCFNLDPESWPRGKKHKKKKTH